MHYNTKAVKGLIECLKSKNDSVSIQATYEEKITQAKPCMQAIMYSTIVIPLSLLKKRYVAIIPAF